MSMPKTKMQPYVKMWYEFFDQGKLMGLRCNGCGAYECPPVPVCSECAGVDLTWTELSGQGELTAFKVVLHADEGFTANWPYVNGNVLLREGPSYGGMVVGVGPDDAEELYNRLPVPVTGEIQDRGNYKFLAFRVNE